MKKTKGVSASSPDTSEEKFSGNLLEALIKPQIIIAFITAIAGPWTIAEVSNDIKEREIQSQIVTKIMELSSQASSEEDFKKKINFLTTLVGDNEFGLKFPSIPELIENERRIEREDLRHELDEKAEELQKQRLEYQARVEELERKKEELGKAADKKLEKEIAELEGKAQAAKQNYESVEADVKIKQDRINGLNQQVVDLMQEQAQAEERTNKLLQDKDTDIATLKQKLEASEKDLALAREQIKKFDVAQNKPTQENTTGNEVAKLNKLETAGAQSP